ncbi:lectin-like domain-containing protein [Aquabacterium sp.]|uniref:lectin-like domain-containing protein n=1 Tax=Aquabacterium sp. TaxID=1872578 RepID=UPI002C999E93|nr:PEP-CTERM sorting domain-containing protein [Aquabacterium sp.]HSW09200.1 PEP-CTERM sorting domain-containing protein [Aquabacterium sp.]
MNIRILTLATLLGTALHGGAIAQQGVSLATGLTDFTQWTLLGSAQASNTTPGNGFTYSNLMLTAPGTGGQGGAGFAPTALTMDFNQAFSFDFHFFIPVSTDLRGDGLTFTLAGTPALGGAGSGLGYDGLGSDSVAFAIDTFHFDDEPVSPSLQILAGGSVTPLAATETGLGDSIRDPNFQWLAVVNYQPSGNDDLAGTLTGTISHINLGSFSVGAAVDFSGLAGAPVYYGFTAANGAATDGHFVTSAMPIPEPHAGLLMLCGGLLLAAWARRRLD